MDKDIVYAALNPRGFQPEIPMISPSPRLKNLKGKVVYCVSQHVRGTDAFVHKVVEQLPKYAPGVIPVYVDKPDFFGADVPQLWNEIATKADALIYSAAA